MAAHKEMCSIELSLDGVPGYRFTGQMECCCCCHMCTSLMHYDQMSAKDLMDAIMMDLQDPSRAGWAVRQIFDGEGGNIVVYEYPCPPDEPGEPG